VGSNPGTIYSLEEAMLDIKFNEINENEGTQMGEIVPLANTPNLEQKFSETHFIITIQPF